jgi:hypothetical protein
MRMPRRHPRAVYEVYDAEEMLGEHQPPAPEGEQAETEQGGPEVERAAGATDRGQARIAPQRPERWAPGRMIAGVLLCTVAVCALAAIGIALLHVLEGAGATHRLSALPPAGPIGARGDAPAQVVHVESVRRLKAVKLTRPVSRARAAGPIHRHDPARPRPASPGSSAVPQSPWAPPVPSLSCACAAAEVEFGFER